MPPGESARPRALVGCHDRPVQIGRTTLANFAALCRTAGASNTPPPLQRAYVRMHRAVEEDPESGLVALAEVSRRVADDDEALGFLGADALEDLFRYHADVLLARLAERRPDDAPLRTAAQMIWLNRHDAYPELRALLAQGDATSQQPGAD